MKYGTEIINFLRNNKSSITDMIIDGKPENGFLKLTLRNGTTKIFAEWDEEDQGLFACAINGEPWDASKRGIPATLKINTESESFSLVTDKPVVVAVNGASLQEWGSQTVSSNKHTIWRKKPEGFDEQLKNKPSGPYFDKLRTPPDEPSPASGM